MQDFATVFLAKNTRQESHTIEPDTKSPEQRSSSNEGKMKEGSIAHMKEGD